MGTYVSITFTSNGKSEFVPRDKVSPLLVVMVRPLMIIISIHKIVVSRNFLSITVVLSCFISSFSILKDSHLESDVCSYEWHFMIASISFVRNLDHVPKKKYLRTRKFSCGHVPDVHVMDSISNDFYSLPPGSSY